MNENLCKNHQGNYAHYAEHNCTICKLQKKVQELEHYKAAWIGHCREVGSSSHRKVKDGEDVNRSCKKKNLST